jgi:hypothetical protein
MKLNVLLLCNKPSVGCDANTIVDHIEAFEQYSKHNIWVYSNLGALSSKLDLNKFDVIIIHYSIFILSKNYLSKSAIKRLRDYAGLKVSFIQDEYRRIHEMVDRLAYLKTDVLFTCFPESEFNHIYPCEKLPSLAKYNNLTGYVPERLTQYTNQPPIHARPLHVGYRGRKLPYWYGALGSDKWKIVDKWKKYVPEDTVRTDISCRETDRIYGAKWIDFLSSCKTTLGVESGTSVMDFTGELEKQVDSHQLTHPYDTFEMVQKKYFIEHEGCHKLNQISPRCFEAIALKTVLVLYEGEYSGILIPGQHYIALKKDFSNINEVLALIQDDDYLQSMADRAYQEIALNPIYGYQAFIKHVDAVVESECIRKGIRTDAVPYESALFYEYTRHKSLKSKVIAYSLAIYQGLPFSVRCVIKGILRPHYLVKHAIKGFYLLVPSALRGKKRQVSHCE